MKLVHTIYLEQWNLHIQMLFKRYINNTNGYIYFCVNVVSILTENNLYPSILNQL